MSTYIGKRVIPKHCGEWDKARTYEVNSIVYDSDQGRSYIARKDVPIGTLLAETVYWAPCADYSAQMTYVNEAIKNLNESISSPYNFMGSCLYDELPADGSAVNDTYYVTDKQCKYTWNGESWYQSSFDESDYADALSAKVDLPTDDSGSTNNGSSGQFLHSNGDGTTYWGEMADGSVKTGKIADAAVTNEKLADGTVTAEKLGPDIIETYIPESYPSFLDTVYTDTAKVIDISDDFVSITVTNASSATCSMTFYNSEGESISSGYYNSRTLLELPDGTTSLKWDDSRLSYVTIRTIGTVAATENRVTVYGKTDQLRKLSESVLYSGEMTGIKEAVVLITPSVRFVKSSAVITQIEICDIFGNTIYTSRSSLSEFDFDKINETGALDGYDVMLLGACYGETSITIYDAKETYECVPERYNATLYGLSTENDDNTEALNDLITLVNSVGGGTIFVPCGTYLFDKEASTSAYSGNAQNNVYLKNNVSIIGESMSGTVFKLYGDTNTGCSMFGAFGGDESPLEGCTFSNFTVDLSEQTMVSYTHKGKAFFTHGIKDCVFRDLRLLETPSTALGIDMLDNVVIDSVYVYKGGKSWSSGGNGGAGIGIGTGLWENENYIIRNCICDSCGHFGIFLEDQGLFSSEKTQNYPKGQIISNNIVRNGNHYGIGLRGGKNVLITGNNLYENVGGIYFDYGAMNVVVTNNLVQGSTDAGILFGDEASYYNCDQIAVYGNTFLENETGVKQAMVPTNSQITGNIYIGNTTDES